VSTLFGLLNRWLGADHAYALYRLACYVGVSAIALAVDVTVFRSALALVPTAAGAAACGFLFGVMTHYMVSSRLAFSDLLKGRGAAAEAPVFGQFFMAGATGLTVTSFVVWVVADIGGYHPYTAKACAVVFSFICVFAVMRFVVLGNFLQRSDAN
jgi:putative flippase GtrA